MDTSYPIISHAAGFDWEAARAEWRRLDEEDRPFSPFLWDWWEELKRVNPGHLLDLLARYLVFAGESKNWFFLHHIDVRIRLNVLATKWGDQALREYGYPSPKATLNGYQYIYLTHQFGFSRPFYDLQYHFSLDRQPTRDAETYINLLNNCLAKRAEHREGHPADDGASQRIEELRDLTLPDVPDRELWSLVNSGQAKLRQVQGILVQEFQGILDSLEGRTTGSFHGNAQLADTVRQMAASYGVALTYEGKPVKIVCLNPEATSFQLRSAVGRDAYVASTKLWPMLKAVPISDIPKPPRKNARKLSEDA